MGKPQERERKPHGNLFVLLFFNGQQLSDEISIKNAVRLRGKSSSASFDNEMREVAPVQA